MNFYFKLLSHCIFIATLKLSMESVTATVYFKTSEFLLSKPPKFLNFVTHLKHNLNIPRLELNSGRIVDEFGIEIPPFNIDPVKVEQQVQHYGPNIPEILWKKPDKPIGVIARRGMAPDVRFIGVDRNVMSRMMRRKYKSMIYSNVRRCYKEYIKNARNTNELIYWKGKLDSLPKDSSRSKFKRICMLTGRTRAVYRIVGLTRHKFRELGNKGLIPGLMQANW